jgi:glutathione S-transferase
VIYHAALPADWEEAVRAGRYEVSTRGRSLADEGFIHAAYERQVEGVLNRYYTDVDAVVLLVIDRGAVGAPVLDEAVAGEQFPHIYGALPVAAVVDAVPWQREPGRRWDRAASRSGPESRPDR